MAHTTSFCRLNSCKNTKGKRKRKTQQKQLTCKFYWSYRCKFVVTAIAAPVLPKMKIAVEGCMHGDLDKVYKTIQYMEQIHTTKIDLLLCCGDFQVRSCLFPCHRNFSTSWCNFFFSFGACRVFVFEKQ